jgi:DNA-binding response OmpR family regulator
VSRDAQVGEALAARLVRAGFAVKSAASADEARTRVRRWEPDVVVAEHATQDALADDLVRLLARRCETPPVVVTIRPAPERCITVVQLRPSGDEIGDAIRALVAPTGVLAG